MPRIPRMVINDETTVYHVISRTGLDEFPLGDVEKDFMLDLIRRYSALYLVEILRNSGDILDIISLNFYLCLYNRLGDIHRNITF
jgi:hypothetical protein